MATNYPFGLDREEHDFATRWASSILLAALVVLAVVLFLAAAWPGARASEAAWMRHVVANCRSQECLSPAQVLSADYARAMKRELGNRVLVVDIGTPGEPQKNARMPVDAYVPFMEPGSAWDSSAAATSTELTFRIDFCTNVDDALRAAHLRHEQPVILLSPSMERTMLAALLLQEHGYSYVLVMNS